MSDESGLKAMWDVMAIDEKTYTELRMERIVELLDEMRAEGYCAGHMRPLEEEFTFRRGWLAGFKAAK